MSDIIEIKRLLCSRAQSVAEMLLPAGKKEGPEWRAGSTNGNKGHSLGVHLVGEKAGVWADFSTGQGGDLLDLWRAVKGISLVQALDQARSYLGIQRHEPYRDVQPTYQRPPKPQCSTPSGKVLDYLVTDRRISPDVLKRYKIGAIDDKIIFPFLLPSGTLALAKQRQSIDGARPIPTSAGCEPILFGWQAIPDDVREVILSEGEIDTLSWASYGFHALSVPYGGGRGEKQKWIENDFERLERFEKIFVSMDMDRPGEEAAEEICGRLGRHRCFRVKLPHKDANECRKRGMTKEEMASILDKAESLDPAGLKRAGDYEEDVLRLFWPEQGTHAGYRTPYQTLDGKLLFRPGEVTLWSGASGSGKSQMLSDCIVDWIRQGSRVCLGSLEMKPSQSLKRMCKQAGGVDRPTEGYLSAIMKYLDKGLLIYDKVGKAGVDSILEIFDYARAKYGCDQFIIDSLMRLGIESDNYNAQEGAVYKMVGWAIDNNVHLHLVAHSRKSGIDKNVPETEDVKGAMEIGANAFNILTIWRNKKLEDELRIAVEKGDGYESLNEKPGVILNVAKQRNGDFEGKVSMWFDKDTYRYQTAYDKTKWSHRSYVDYQSDVVVDIKSGIAL